MIQLKPFRDSPQTKGLRLSVDLKRSADELAVVYELSGPLKDIVIPGPSSRAQKRDFLWEHTCFECFISEPNSESYVEWNFSPSGDWGYYEFEGYRKSRIQIFGFDECEISWIQSSFELCRLEAKLQMTDSGPLTLGISAVLEHRGADKSYWALGHFGEKADFHNRQGFLAKI